MGQPGFEPGTSVLSSSILAEYLDELALKGRSSTYISHVRRCLDKYVQQYTELTHVSARAFLRQYSHLSASTRASYTIYVRGLFKHFGLPFDLSVRIPRRLPPHVASSDIERLAYSISHKATHKQSSVRDMVLLETAINTGLRRSELANLKVRDIDFDSQRLKVVNGKGGRDRVISLRPAIRDSLARLCIGKLQSDTVFGLRPKTVSAKVRYWAKKAGVDIHAHSFRHYFATTLVDKGANIRAVQELLGHESLATTEKYLAVSAKHLEETIKLLG